MKPGEVRFIFGVSYIWGIDLHEGTPVERALSAAKVANPHNIAVLTEVEVCMDDGVVKLEGDDFDAAFKAIEERKAELDERSRQIIAAMLS